MLYIVNALVAREAADSWLGWMEEDHIQEVVDTGFFADAVLARVPEDDTPERLAFRMIYRAKSAADLDRYQAEQAPRLKADHIERFGEHVTATRQILPVIDTFVPA